MGDILHIDTPGNMPQNLQGSCHCGLVTFSFPTHTPVPYQLCQCSICRKVGGYMGSVNIMGLKEGLEVKTGKDKLKSYRAVLTRKPDDSPDERTKSQRYFCGECSRMLWLHDATYDEYIYPFASCIDTPLSPPSTMSSTKTGRPLKMVTVKRSSCPDHMPVPEGAEVHQEYADGEGIEWWHKEHGVWIE